MRWRRKYYPVVLLTFQRNDDEIYGLGIDEKFGARALEYKSSWYITGS